MSRDAKVSNVTRREFVVRVSSMAAGYLIVPSAPGATAGRTSPLTKPDHVVIFDIANGKISYKSRPPQADPENLKVNKGEVVTWEIKSSAKKHHVTVIFKDYTPFVDEYDTPVYVFQGSEADEPNGIGINTSIGLDNITCSYFVAATDDDTGKTYTADPKIIVGDGIMDARTQLTLAIQRLKMAVRLDPDLKNKINPIEGNLNQIIHGLKK